ncbi:Htur_1727 family rSAM-partnered candidate RiPP [Halosegnis sp.]|uniref:Htur_1727 family rSAM-partnered candidate RiPP n=1 Tax=Halosegnis sp. TaxID=2864959 RepID=UPI0035D4EE4A
MSEQVDRTRVERPPGERREWETFCRSSADAPLRHVGSVTAPSESVAYEQAATLFPDAVDLWLCPAESVARYAAQPLADRAEGDV